MKKFKFVILTLLLVYGVIELISYAGLYVQDKYRDLEYAPVDVFSRRHAGIIKDFLKDDSEYVAFSPVLGWSIRENGSSRTYRANSRGIRGDKEYGFDPPAGARRITTFGDSFTHCDDVVNDETWQACMERLSANLEVINFGVGGFGLDQSYLRYLEEGQHYKSEIVLIGFMSENISRNVNTYRPFYRSGTGIPLTKPRFVLEEGNLSLIPNAMQELDDYKRLLRHPDEVLAELRVHDYYYDKRYLSNRYDWSPTCRLIRLFEVQDYRKPLEKEIIVNRQYNEASEAFRVTTKLFDAFCEAAIENGSTPVILVFPTRGDVVRYQRDKTSKYTPLLDYFDTSGYDHIDIIGAIEDLAVKDIFKGHYSPLANERVAKYILSYLDTMEGAKDREDPSKE